MKKIIGHFHISTNDPEEFYKKFTENINILQNDNQEVEIQYNTQIINNLENPILYSALVIGRKGSSC
jgi:hypothetical protein